MNARKTLAICALLAGASAPFHSACADGFDRRLGEVNVGPFWRHGNLVINTTVASAIAGALWMGADNRLGRTLWQSSEAWAVASTASQVLKVATGRQRPTETDDPGRWLSGGRSFPSGHVTAAATVVTPPIIEYKDDYPAVWLLAAIPVYEMVSRVKSHSHWQSDVIAGAALGAGVGHLESKHGPWVVKVLPRGMYVGLHGKF